LISAMFRAMPAFLCVCGGLRKVCGVVCVCGA